MRKISLLYLVGLTITVSTAVGQPSITDNITEGATGLTTTLPGVTISGSQDGWVITAPSGSYFAGLAPGNPSGMPLAPLFYNFVLDEPSSEGTTFLPKFNLISVTVFPFEPGPFQIIWDSDLTLSQLPANHTGLPSGLNLANPQQNTQIPFFLQDLGDLQPQNGVPDLSSTLTLLSFSLLVIIGMTRTHRARF